MNTEENQRRIRELTRLLEPMPALASMFPWSLGMLIVAVPTTLAMMMGGAVTPWRWFYQGVYVCGASVLAVVGWRARRAWKRRP